MIRALLSLSFLLLCTLPASNSFAQVYKTIDKNGNVSYTDKAPKNDSDKTTEIESSVLNTMESSHTKEVKKSGWLKKIDKERKAEKEVYDKWYKEYALAKKDLRKAQHALKKGKDPKEEDYVGYSTATGSGVRPSQDYLKRVQNLTSDVKKARRTLKLILKRKP